MPHGVSLFDIIEKLLCRGISEMSCESNVELYVGAGDSISPNSGEVISDLGELRGRIMRK